MKWGCLLQSGHFPAIDNREGLATVRVSIASNTGNWHRDEHVCVPTLLLGMASVSWLTG